MRNTKYWLLGLGILAASAFAQEDYSTWAERRDITINTTNLSNGANVANPVHNFPVLVRLNSNHASVFAAEGGRNSLRFTSEDGTRLHHETELWDAVGQQAAIWVRVPTVLGNAHTIIRMYAGKAGAVDSSNGPAVFDTATGFRGVWHLGETASPSEDATTLGTDAVWFNSPASVPGLIGNAINFANVNGTSAANAKRLTAEYNVANENFKFNSTDGVTLSVWVNRNSNNGQNEQGVLCRYRWDGANQRQVCLSGLSGGQWVLFRSVNGAGGGNETNFGNIQGVDGEWTHLVGTVRNGEQVLYVNGVANVTQNTATIGSLDSIWPNSPLHIGRFENAGCCLQAVDGIVDEARIANTTRSADWVKLEYETQKAPTSPAVVEVSGIVTGVAREGARRHPTLGMHSVGSGFVFSVPAVESARVSVLDMRGRVVWSSATGGRTEVAWNGSGANGDRVVPGVYMVRVTAREKGVERILAQRSFSLMP